YKRIDANTKGYKSFIRQLATMHYIPILFKISGFDPPLVCVFAWRLLDEDAAMVVADVLILLFDLVSIFFASLDPFGSTLNMAIYSELIEILNKSFGAYFGHVVIYRI
ncbi:hypothetical protein ACJX0J_019046, partial [Zea mays]